MCGNQEEEEITYMQNMTLENIAGCLGCKLYQAAGQEQTEITGAVLDSRKVEQGYAFFATKGERVDGHSFIPQVAEKGAALVICQNSNLATGLLLSKWIT